MKGVSNAVFFNCVDRFDSFISIRFNREKAENDVRDLPDMHLSIGI